MFGGHTDAAVGDGEANPVATDAGFAGDLEEQPSLFGKFARVAEQIKEGLPDFRQVAVHGAYSGGDLDDQVIAIFLDQRMDGGLHLVDHGGDVDGLGVDRHFSGLDFREIEHVIDQAEKVPTGAMDFFQVGDEFFLSEVFRFLDEHFAVPDDGVHGGAQFMTHVG